MDDDLALANAISVRAEELKLQDRRWRVQGDAHVYTASFGMAKETLSAGPRASCRQSCLLILIGKTGGAAVEHLARDASFHSGKQTESSKHGGKPSIDLSAMLQG